MSVGKIVNYFAFYARKYLKEKNKSRNFSIVYTKVVVDDFLATIRSLKRTRVAEIYFNKSLLGSAGLKYSNRTTSLKRDMMLTLTAEKKETITETAIDIYNKLNDSGSGISKVRIYGKDKHNSEVMFDTSVIEKVEHLSISINPLTGEISTTEILSGLEALVNKL